MSPRVALEINGKEPLRHRYWHGDALSQIQMKRVLELDTVYTKCHGLNDLHGYDATVNGKTLR